MTLKGGEWKSEKSSSSSSNEFDNKAVEVMEGLGVWVREGAFGGGRRGGGDLVVENGWEVMMAAGD